MYFHTRNQLVQPSQIEKEEVISVRITYFQRKRRAGSNFSLEQIFSDVRSQLSGLIRAQTWIAPYVSDGFLRRLLICLSAIKAKDEVNHVTGDINFVAIFLPKRRTVLTVLDLGILQRLYGLKYWIVWLFWFQLPVWRSTVVTVISEATQESLLACVYCRPQKIVVIPVAIGRRFVRSNKMFEEDCPCILQIGTAPNKNLTRVIKALHGIRCNLWIVGKLALDQHELLEEHGIQFSNFFDLDEDEIVDLYKRCDIVLFASTFEGFGMPILEANATGRPVITSNVTSMPEVAGDAAYLVDPFDVNSIKNAVNRLIADQGLREKLVANGFENVKRYHASEIARQYLEVYKRIVSR